MLIGIDASRANRDRKSGTEYYSYYLIRNLAKIDSKNQYILYTDKPLKGGLLDLTTSDTNHLKSGEIKFDKDGFQIIKSPYNNFKAKVLRWPFRFFWTLGRLSLEMLLKKPDLLFVPAHALPLILPKKSINTIHDVAFERDKKVYLSDSIFSHGKTMKKLVNFFAKLYTGGKYGASHLDYLSWSTRIALKRATKIITVSHFSKKEIIDIYKTNSEKIKVVYNGFNNDFYKKIEDQEKINQVLKKYEIQQPYFLYIGRLEKKKNTPALVEAFAIIRERNKEMKERLVLLGYGSFGYDEVKYLVEENHLVGDVIMPGWVEEEDVPYLYNGASAFIFPTKHEGFGFPVIQAIGCGVPTACSNIPVLREVMDDAALFFNPNNVCDIAFAMKEIVSNQDLRKELIEKGNKRARDFSWRKCAEETLEIINSLSA